ncbi:E3 ubiquitin-protein ligase Topors-like [Plodia interpunctella]|uniref:E3 ubiquitin-protein ligase Topors-like n=1 Tax=Plodia interpunctella TaxID=58824 RepID=UPI002367FE0B|nr:E3 ubiquitin-protein ligase Topors-like [Plodia interpunctella]XP_053621039.1 E3 ubiquitin-protein ligase Topors-like [Plodia interpunctella]
METVSSVTQDDSSGANPNSVKSEDSSPQNESGRGSPPPNCAICLGTCKNKSFTDSCLHQFCFTCLLTWSKVKAECPLCKQNFKSIIHNVRSNHQYEEYLVEQRETEESIDRFDIDSTIAQANRRFRYRTTLTLPRRDSLAIQQLLLQQYPTPPRAALRPPRHPAAFRRTVYRHNLYARPLPDFTGRFRDCSPQFYRYNDTQMHRLVPWLNRELHYLLNENIGHISYVITRILELLPQYHINSPEFRAAMQPYFRDRTEHFLHELYCFASTPYDMTGYDRYVRYTTDTRISTMVNEVISSSDSDASVDSDIVMVSSSEPAEPPPGPSRIAGPSRVPQPVYPQNYIAEPTNVIPIETISHSDTDDDSSEVMVVGYIKPPQDRTPEVVDLLGSDSDVIVQDATPPPPPPSSERAEDGAVPLVKLILKRHMTSVESSDDDSYGARRSQSDTASTSHTWRSTPEPEPWLPPVQPSSSSSSSTSTSSSDDTLTEYLESSSERSSDRRSRPVKKKTKRKSRKEIASKEKKKSKKRSSRPRKDRSAPDKEKRKRKTRSGKGVKSSKKTALPQSSSPLPVAEEQPGPSGTCNSRKRRVNKDRKRRRSSRTSRESKRLKSVVNVINNKTLEEPSSSASLSSAVINPNSTSAGPSRSPPLELDLPGLDATSVAVQTRDYTDSDWDELPLNLTVQKTFHSL